MLQSMNYWRQDRKCRAFPRQHGGKLSMKPPTAPLNGRSALLVTGRWSEGGQPSVCRPAGGRRPTAFDLSNGGPASSGRSTYLICPNGPYNARASNGGMQRSRSRRAIVFLRRLRTSASLSIISLLIGAWKLARGGYQAVNGAHSRLAAPNPNVAAT